jgi:hypothetical protein
MLTVRITTALMKTDSRMELITMEVVVMTVVESRPVCHGSECPVLVVCVYRMQ